MENINSKFSGIKELVLNNKKIVISVIITLLLVISLPAGVYLAQNPQILKSRASEKKNVSSMSGDVTSSKKPEFVEGEVLIKLKNTEIKPKITNNKKAQEIDLNKQPVAMADIDQNNLPASLKAVDEKYQIQTIEKVFKGVDIPREETNKFKQKFSQDISKGKRKINESQLLKTDLSKIYKLSFNKATPTEQVVQELSQSSDIEYAEPNYIYHEESDPNDPYFLDQYPSSVGSRDPNWNPPHDYQWNIKKTNSVDNWQVDVSGIIVAVIDTGLDVNHPDLGNVWVNPAEIPGDGLDNDSNGCIDDINGCHFGTSAGNIADDDNHGTHVSGIISAKTNNSVGLAGITGNAKIMAVKAMNNGYGTASDIALGIHYAADNGAQVMNMSLGGSYSQTMKEALDYATNLGVISVVSAGNGNAYSPSRFPASYKPAITVGGVDEDLNKMKYANYGPNIDVAAPGGGKPCMYYEKPSYCSNILSLKSSQNENDAEYVVGGQYLRMSGTSMATPHVAGVVALLLAQHPSFTLADIENYIRFNSIDPQGKGHNEKTGWGIINSTGNNFVNPTNIDFVVNDSPENSLIGKKFDVRGTIKADNFDHFEVSYRLQDKSWSSEGVKLVGDGKTQITPGNYPDEWNPKIAAVTLPDASLLGVYEVKVTLFMTNGKSLSSTKTINFQQKPGTQWLNGSGDGEILIDDINNDGNKEIILYNYGEYDHHKLAVFDNRYNLLWEVPQAGEAVVGDIDSRSAGKEVIIQTTGNIYVYSANGTLSNDMTLNYVSDGEKNLMVLDTDGNGKNELYFHESRYSNNILHSFEQNSSNQFVEKWSYSVNGTRYNHIWPKGGDIDGDGKKEIIVLNTGNKLEALNYQGRVIAQYTFAGSYLPDAMILADMDKDGKDEVIVHIQWGDTKMLKLNGNTFDIVWSYNNSNNMDSLAIGDFNNDSYPEAIAQVNNTGNETVIDRNGQIVYNTHAPLYWSSTHNGGVLLADLENNSKIDIIHGALYGFDDRYYLGIREYDKNTGQIDFKDGDWKPFSGSNLAISDLDNNGKLDLIIAGLGIIEYNTLGTVYWPYRYHDSQRTGSYSFSTVSSIPTPTPSGCRSDADCPSGYKCQIQATTLRYCPDGDPNCNAVAGKCVPISTGKSTPTPTATASASVSVSCSACGADVDKNGSVAIMDMMRVAQCMRIGYSGSAPGQFSCQKADANGDGKINASDLNCVREQYGKQCTGPRR